jgi:streptogramin lyase
MVMLLVHTSSLSSQTPGEVISSVPSPSSPFGLTWDGEYLWVGTYGGILYRVDSSNGDVITQIDAPGTIASGLGWDWQALWVSDRDDDVIQRFDPETGEVLSTLPAPESWPGGLGWDGWELWHSNYYSPSYIYYIDHISGVVLDSFPAPQERGMGITLDGISLWNGDYINGMIHELDPETGDVLNSFPAPDDSPHDLAYDGHYLWVVIGGGANMLYQIEPGNKSVSIALSPQSATVPAGGNLIVNGSLVNHTESIQTFSFHVDIYLPNGNPYPGNPLFGPFTVTMQPGGYFSGILTHPVPGPAPKWDYQYQGVITQDEETVDVTSFNFTVE